MSAADTPQGHRLHLGIAEQGKLYALAGDHKLALTYYREAIRMAVSSSAPEVFFRHYMECTLESLERMGAFAEVVGYADRAIAHYAELTPSSEEQRALIRTDLVSIHQRRGAALLKMGRVEEARGALERAVALAREASMPLPLSQALLGWITRGFHVEPQRVLMEQEATRYFSVRPDTVDKTLAVALPKGHAAILRTAP
jgi:tetratricopeptide (TPR) repeat protein